MHAWACAYVCMHGHGHAWVRIPPFDQNTCLYAYNACTRVHACCAVPGSVCMHLYTYIHCISTYAYRCAQFKFIQTVESESQMTPLPCQKHPNTCMHVYIHIHTHNVLAAYTRLMTQFFVLFVGLRPYASCMYVCRYVCVCMSVYVCVCVCVCMHDITCMRMKCMCVCVPCCMLSVYGLCVCSVCF